MLRRILLGPVLLALAAPASSVLAAEPWKFASPAEQRDADKKNPGYWFERYAKAVEALAGSKPDPDLAIALLRLAVAAKPDNDPEATNPITKETVAYFPYYHLAVALDRKGDCAAAQKCLDRGEARIGGTKLAAGFARLKEGVVACARKGEFLAQADAVLSWEGAQSEIALSPEGRAKVPQIKTLRGRLGEPGADAGAVSGQLGTELLGLCRTELKSRADRAAQLGSGPWKEAFSKGPAAPSPASCQAPAGEATPKAIGECLTTLKQCDGAVVQALRRAGRFECDRLDGLRKEVQRLAGDWRAWIEREGSSAPAAEAAGDLPAACSVKWEGAPGARVSEEFQRLDAGRSEIGQAMEAKRKDLEARLAAKRAKFLESQKGMLASLPAVPPPDCAQVLQIGQAVGKVNAIRASLSPDTPGVPPRELLQREKLVESVREELGKEMKAGVERLRQYEKYPQIATANLGALPGALDAYLGRRGPGELETLCRAAKGAQSDFRDWIGKNVPFMKASLGRTMVALSAAERGHSRAPGACEAEAGGLSCLAGGLAALRAVQSKSGGADTLGWVTQAQAEVGKVQECLKDLHKVTEACFTAIAGRAQGSLKMLESVSAIPAASSRPEEADLGRLRAGVETMRTGLKGITGTLDGLAPLYRTAEGPKCAEVRQVLESSGLAASLASEAAQLLAASAEDADGRETCKVLRDAAVLPELGKAADALKQFDPRIRKLAPFAVLNAAFLAFSRGELDDAILSLREAQGSGAAGTPAKEAALPHAALSYFVFIKAQGLSAGGGDERLAESLKQDAQREARLAMQADSTFDLPDGLFRNESFKKAFQAYTRSGVR